MVAIEDGRVVGTCRLVFRGDVARLGRMAVERDLRGRGLGTAILREAERAALDAGARRISLHAQLSARSLYDRDGYIERGPVFEEEGIDHVSMEKRPELRVDPLSGLRVIVAGERGDRPGAFLAKEEPPPSTPTATRSSRATRTGRRPRSTRCGRTAGPPTDRAGTSGGAQPLSGARWRRRRGAGSTRIRPRRAGAVRVPAGGRGPRGDHQQPAPCRLFARALAGGALGGDGGLAAAHGRAEARPACTDRQRGKDAGASLPHTHAQLYALPFVPAAVARERERFTAYSDPPTAATCSRTWCRRRCGGASGSSRWTTRWWPCARSPPACLPAQLVPRRPVGRFEDDGPTRAALLREVLGRLAAAVGAPPPLNMWVRTAPRAPSASAGGSTCCRAWPTWRGSRWEPACT